METQIRHPVPPVPRGQTPTQPPFPRPARPTLPHLASPSRHREAEPEQLGLLWRGPVDTVALSQDSEELGLSPNLSSPKEVGALGLSPFLIPKPQDSEKCLTWLLPETDKPT